jgi:hypothetical protein
MGGVDAAITKAQRIVIHTRQGPVKGVVGNVAPHLMKLEGDPKPPKIHDLFIDIGTATRKEAEKLVRIGDPITLVDEFDILRGDLAVARAFDSRAEFRFAELGSARGADAIVLGLKPEYAGDRVFAFGVGLASMVFLAYNGKTELYLTDSLDAQKLYNSARNIEIAAWKLANAHDALGEPLLLSNEMGADVRNLSFEREFGKMIAYQDVMAEIAAQRTNRTIRKIVQTLATAVFLPI